MTSSNIVSEKHFNANVEALPPAADASDASGEASEGSELRVWGRLPQLLRWIGGLALLGSAATFLLGGWMDASPLWRYYSFLGLTGALALGLFDF